MKNIKNNWNYLLLTGATASGKTSLAIELAQKFEALIVNCDAMQIYDALPILSAQPGPEDKLKAPHHLFSYVSPICSYNVGQWLEDVCALIKKKCKIIFVGGTGLYFKALCEGIAPIPTTPTEVRAYWRSQLDAYSASHLHRILEQDDPAAASLIKASDGQRIVRALEVWHSTGKSILYWQKQKTKSILGEEKTLKYILSLDREKLHKNINNRVEEMVERGVLNEVQAFLARNIPQDALIYKSIGIKEFQDYLVQKHSLAEALDLIKARTRQYAKRQITWQRHQFDDRWEIYEPF